MAFDEEFISKLKADPVGGVIRLCSVTLEKLRDAPEWYQEDYDSLTEAFALVLELTEAGLVESAITIPDFTGNIGEDCGAIVEYLRQTESYFTSRASVLKLQSLRTRFKSSLGGGFSYEFSQGDLEKVQSLLNELRTLIVASKFFEPDHQQRLLARLEKLQSEIHKRVSDLDRFWGLIGEAGIVLRKFGEDAKPIVDRMREIADIVWRTQSRAEELPSGTTLPLLKSPDDESPGGSVT